MTESSWTHRKGDKKRVVVIGAGVAGMTAAHELVERGYEVEVVEMSGHAFDPTVPRIGGMARTSWARLPPQDPEQVVPEASAGQRPSQLVTDHAPPPIDMKLSDLQSPEAAQFARSLNALPHRRERAMIAARGPMPEAAERPARAAAAAQADPQSAIDQVSVISSRALEPPQRAMLDHMLSGYEVTWGVVPAAEEQPPEDARVQICMEGSRVAGEHGFRFFPSFYRHMFDTMKRIPIEEAVIGGSAGVLTADSPRTVFDALLSAEVLQLGLDPAAGRARSFEIVRRPMRSVQDIRAFFAHVLEGAGYRGEDLFRLAHRYAEYLTSAAIRRKQDYENTSWSAFLGLERFSQYFASHVNSGAQALVAMSSETNDARTIGSIAMQLTLDQMRDNPSDYTDGTLRGPTTIELFEPWQAYLTSHDVRFRCAELAGFYGSGMAVRPAFGTRQPARDGDPPGQHNFTFCDIAPADYHVVTVPVDKFQALFDRAGRSTAVWVDSEGAPSLLSRGDLVTANQLHLTIDEHKGHHRGADPGESNDDISKYLEFPLGNVAKNPDAGPLRYMCGIQFYFPADVRVILGHTVCLDSAWGVSYISQVQYWQDHIRDHSGVRGIFSVIFTRFEERAAGLVETQLKTALECDGDEIADRVWKQIVDAWDVGKYGKLPQPEYYYLDESLRRVDGTWANDTPYLVNRVGDWDKRGGSRLPDGNYAYRMQLGHTVFAGAFMRTETRLNTMEAANESGRRAVNAILDHDRASHQLCTLWSIEDHEIPEARPLRELDRRVFRRGGRHILRHAGFEAALRAMPWDLLRLGLPTTGESR